MSVLTENLARCPLFKDFTDTGLGIMASVFTERVVPEGTPLFVENMLSESFFLVQKGQVRVSVRGTQGKEQVIAALGEGDYFGELSLVSPDSRRVVTVTASTKLEVLELRQRDFARLQMQKPQACTKLILAIAHEFGRKMGESRETIANLLAVATRA